MMSMRSIYLSIRAMNYTDRATRQVGKNIDFLIRKQNEMRRNAVTLMSAGLMWVAMSGLAIFAISKIIEKSSEGRRAIRVFSRSANRLMKAFGTAFVRALGPTIKALTKLFDWISSLDPAVLQVIASFATALVVIMGLYGVFRVLGGAIEWVMASNLRYVMSQQYVTYAQDMGVASTMRLATAMHFLQIALGMVMISFTFFVMIGRVLGKSAAPVLAFAAAIFILAGALIALKGVASLGATMAHDLGIMAISAGIGAGMAAGVYATGNYQYGTRLVQRTHPAIVHAGDVITRPDRGDTTPQQQERGFPKHYYNVTLSFGDVKTKASKEELEPMILNTLKKALNNKV